MPTTDNDLPATGSGPPPLPTASLTPSEPPPVKTPVETTVKKADVSPFAAAPNAMDDDSVPEYEPLTPELVEDEAIRGDFVLKWAVVLLAFLLGSSRIAETATLVHVKTGQYLAQHGFLPPRTDVFSYTAGDRGWTNLAWGFDLLAAGVYGVGEWAGLSLFKAIMAAVTFALIVRISRPGLPTWWGAICAAVALLACHVRLTAQPALVTLLATSLTLWLLHHWQQQKSRTASLWYLVPLFFLWSNADSRMFLGLGLLLLYGSGDALGTALGRGASMQPAARKQFWTVFAACVVVAMIHPFGWKSVGAPALIYGNEYPAFRTYFGNFASGPGLQYSPLTYVPFWTQPNLDISSMAGLLLIGVAAVSFALNWARLELSHVAMYLGYVASAVLALHELPVAGIVCCVLAVLNGQAWYAARFRQTYSVETSELLFSRGGRALTVLAFAAIAFLGGTGRLRGVQAPRTGYGIDYTLGATIDSLRDVLTGSLDDRPFNFLPTQGDMLIWLDKKVFIDGRIPVYAGRPNTVADSPASDLLKLHSDLKVALLRFHADINGSGKRELWTKTFDTYKITHILPRLTGALPDYTTLFDLLRENRDWQLTRLGAATAVFYRLDAKTPELKSFVERNRLNFQDEAWKQSDTLPTARVAWAQPPDFYQKYLWAHKREIPNRVQEALHLVRLAVEPQLLPEWLYDSRPALALLGIRRAHAGLAIAPDCSEGYLALGQAYWLLARWDSAVSRVPNLQRDGLRYFQAVSSLNQAAVADPASQVAHIAAFQVYESSGKLDLALRELEAVDNQLGDGAGRPGEVFAQRDHIRKMIEQLRKLVAAVDDELAMSSDRGTGPVQRAQQAYQRGCVLKALHELDANPQALAQNYQAQGLHAVLLLESGRPEEAYMETGMLEEAARQGALRNWEELAALTSLANADYLRAIQVWSDAAKQTESNSFMQLLSGMVPNASALQPLPWPIGETGAAVQHFQQRPEVVAGMRRQTALVELEGGALERAVRNFRAMLDANPETPYRAMAGYYLKQLTGEEIDPFPPSERIPVLFEPERATAATK